MSDQKHTPGPWITDWKGPQQYAVIGTVPFMSGENDAQTIPGIAFYISTEANARLIAAAPELLEACQYVVQYHREHDSGEGELFSLDFVTTCIAAIAKAKGE